MISPRLYKFREFESLDFSNPDDARDMVQALSDLVEAVYRLSIYDMIVFENISGMSLLNMMRELQQRLQSINRYLKEYEPDDDHTTQQGDQDRNTCETRAEAG